ncbi:helix-turn-helix domain-containing protein [Cupriavidus malaysiensis]|uniref:XRE family transcriptional regulator n=1 Tax=Cupriavidus malaysiensis TaxID=367825 RepID=A0ABM6FGN8_9BURK|nr:helix-turn-helix domain-containing protein [Cupriavidus malaysiensis]AOZ11115.1 hypothetical protein BKK80_34720 [Cupriavidus malaysiensis]
MTGEEFKEIRHELGWSFSQASQALGVSAETLKRASAGRQLISPSLERLLLASLLIHRKGLMTEYDALQQRYRQPAAA